MTDAFGVKGPQESFSTPKKGLIGRWQRKRELKHRTAFSQRKGGDGKLIPTKELHRIRWRDNPTDKKKVKEMKTSLKAEGQKRGVLVNIDRNDNSKTILLDGHHRVAAQRKLRNKYTKTNIMVNKGMPRALRTAYVSGRTLKTPQARAYQAKKNKKLVRGYIREEKIARRRKYVPEETIPGLPKGVTV